MSQAAVDAITRLLLGGRARRSNAARQAVSLPENETHVLSDGRRLTVDGQLLAFLRALADELADSEDDLLN